MKIPKRIKIAGHWVRRKYCKKLRRGKRDLLGLADYTHDTIYLVKAYQGEKLPEAKQAEVFFHEILHQVSDKYGFSLGEKVVAPLSAGLFQVLRDNDLDFRK